MKINAIRARNVLGARDIDARLFRPVALFCGFNGAGKSSIQEAVRLALQGETLRVVHKKDYGLMVTEGAKEGFVKVEADNLVYEYRLPDGTHTVPREFTGAEAENLHAVLNAQHFASKTPDERRAFLTSLTKAKPDAAKIKALMLEGGIDEARIELALPMLRSGFPAACEIAKQKATEAKGAWKETTGSTWGAIKGAAWVAPEVQAPEQEAIDAATALAAEKEQELSDLQQQLGATVEKFNTRNEKAAKIEAAKTKAANLPRLREKQVREHADLANYKAEVERLEALAGTAPRKGLVHDMAVFLNDMEFAGEDGVHATGLIERYEAEHGKIGAAGDDDAREKLPAMIKSRDMMQRCVDNNTRDITEAEQAEANLAMLGTLEELGDTLLDDVKAQVAALQKEVTQARADLAGLQELAKAAGERDAKTESAKAHHLDVTGWLKVAEQFAPDGLPSQILSKALEPINKKLREAATSTDWMQVAIRPDMTITANGRMYSLLSESEKWMVDAHIAYVIAQLAGLKLIVLDRFDVLDNNHRPELLGWLADMAYEGELDTALVFGTLKVKPSGLPDEVQVLWIDGGEQEAEKLAA